jgi:hypothetical protein
MVVACNDQIREGGREAVRRCCYIDGPLAWQAQLVSGYRKGPPYIDGLALSLKTSSPCSFHFQRAEILFAAVLFCA